MEISGTLHGAIVRAGAGVREHRLPSGTIIEARGGAARSAAVRHPFRVSSKFVEDEWKFLVYFGTINGLVPTGANTLQSFPASPRYVVLDVDTDGRQVTGASLITVSSAPSPPSCVMGAPPTSFQWAIAFIGTQDAPAIHQIVDDNLVAERSVCNQTEKGDVVPGTSPWDYWYTWKVSEAIEPQVINL